MLVRDDPPMESMVRGRNAPKTQSIRRKRTKDKYYIPGPSRDVLFGDP